MAPTSRTRPQSMMFTLYGDYIRHRGEQAWVGSLIKIAGQFELSQRAVRSVLSRMTQHGWLEVERIENRSYYGPTARTQRLLEAGERRIFTRRATAWSRTWHLLVYSIPERDRELRSELRKQLAWLGYGPISNGSWVCPHNLEHDVRDLVTGLGVSQHVETFTAIHNGYAADRDLAARCWDLDGINLRYADFLAHWEPFLDEVQQRNEVVDSECFVQRFLLIHEYRKLLFVDPDLPPELLPGAWCGGRARDLFEELHVLLAAPANRYFDSVFEAPPNVSLARSDVPLGRVEAIAGMR